MQQNFTHLPQRSNLIADMYEKDASHHQFSLHTNDIEGARPKPLFGKKASTGQRAYPYSYLLNKESPILPDPTGETIGRTFTKDQPVPRGGQFLAFENGNNSPPKLTGKRIIHDSPERGDSKNHIFPNQAYEDPKIGRRDFARNLSTQDIEGAVSGSKISKAIRNKELAKKHLYEDQRLRDSLDTFQNQHSTDHKYRQAEFNSKRPGSLEPQNPFAGSIAKGNKASDLENFRENYKNFYRGYTPDANNQPNRFVNKLGTKIQNPKLRVSSSLAEMKQDPAFNTHLRNFYGDAPEEKDHFHKNYANFFRGSTPQTTKVGKLNGSSEKLQANGFLNPTSVKSSKAIGSKISSEDKAQFHQNLNQFFGTQPLTAKIGDLRFAQVKNSANPIAQPNMLHQANIGSQAQMKFNKPGNIDNSSSLQHVSSANEPKTKNPVLLASQNGQDPMTHKYNTQFNQMEKHFELQKQQFTKHQQQNRHIIPKK